MNPGHVAASRGEWVLRSIHPFKCCGDVAAVLMLGSGFRTGRCAQAGQALAMLSQEQMAHVTSYSGLVAGARQALGPLGQVRALVREQGPYGMFV